MRSAVFSSLLVATVLLTVGIAVRADDPGPRVWDFEQVTLNSAPEFFRYNPELADRQEEWLVVQDGDKKVLRQQNFPDAKDGRAFAILKDVEIEDMQLSVKIKAVSGVLEQSAGLVWRYRNDKNHLLARLDIEDKELRLIRLVDGNRVVFGEKKELNLVTGQWYTLRVDHRGDKIQVYLDQDVLVQENDRHFREKGRVGLWSQNDSVMNFDDLTIRRPGRR